MPLPEHGDFKIYPWILPVPLRVLGAKNGKACLTPNAPKCDRNFFPGRPERRYWSRSIEFHIENVPHHTVDGPSPGRPPHKTNDDVVHDLVTKDHRRHNLDQRIVPSTKVASRTTTGSVGGLCRHYADESRTNPILHTTLRRKELPTVSKNTPIKQRYGKHPSTKHFPRVHRSRTAHTFHRPKITVDRATIQSIQVWSFAEDPRESTRAVRSGRHQRHDWSESIRLR